ncbi:hypothetical protein A3Q56_08089 [Intoshia linei]|uniref:Major facilitator superfamily (MFS) profile domain-containing protein n=1 Tax=Intoshia linei TaxID=1819745 RepID=A0A177AQW6_9BILA|nr:hypothetical protein A3Q56_08089 [Intoshia linei]
MKKEGLDIRSCIQYLKFMLINLFDNNKKSKIDTSNSLSKFKSTSYVELKRLKFIFFNFYEILILRFTLSFPSIMIRSILVIALSCKMGIDVNIGIIISYGAASGSIMGLFSGRLSKYVNNHHYKIIILANILQCISATLFITVDKYIIVFIPVMLQSCSNYISRIGMSLLTKHKLSHIKNDEKSETHISVSEINGLSASIVSIGRCFGPIAAGIFYDINTNLPFFCALLVSSYSCFCLFSKYQSKSGQFMVDLQKNNRKNKIKKC